MAPASQTQAPTQPQVSGVAAAAGAAGAIAPVAGTVATSGAGIALSGAGAVAAAAVMASLVRFLAALGLQHKQWLGRSLGAYGPSSAVAGVVAREMQLEREFARNSANRVAAKLPAALAIADPNQRAAAVRQILEDEQRFAQQRQTEMLSRAIAAMGREQLRVDSPLGAYWRLGIAQQHTEGCKFMAGKFWPWAVLDRVHPPRHYGCTSSLHGFGEAIHNGWMTPGDAPDVRAAVRAAAGVVMEGEDADALLRELDVRERLLEAGVPAERLAAIDWQGLVLRGGSGGATASLPAAE